MRLSILVDVGMEEIVLWVDNGVTMECSVRFSSVQWSVRFSSVRLGSARLLWMIVW